jgi:hypothetical protein
MVRQRTLIRAIEREAWQKERLPKLSTDALYSIQMIVRIFLKSLPSSEQGYKKRYKYRRRRRKQQLGIRMVYRKNIGTCKKVIIALED